MNVSTDDLRKAASNLNEVLEPQPKIDAKAPKEKLQKQIIEAAEMLEDGDVISDGTLQVLLDLECDVPAKVKTTKTGKKKTSSAKAGKQGKKEGVSDFIVKTITERQPIKKDKVLKALVEKFPDRDPEAMGRSISWIVSKSKSDERYGVVMELTDDGYVAKKIEKSK